MMDSGPTADGMSPMTDAGDTVAGDQADNTSGGTGGVDAGYHTLMPWAHPMDD
jgi:hypothetical protein